MVLTLVTDDGMRPSYGYDSYPPLELIVDGQFWLDELLDDGLVDRIVERASLQTAWIQEILLEWY